MSPEFLLTVKGGGCLTGRLNVAPARVVVNGMHEALSDG